VRAVLRSLGARPWGTGPLPLALLLLFAGASRASPAGPEVEVLPVEGPAFGARLAGLDLGGARVELPSAARRIAATELRELRFAPLPGDRRVEPRLRVALVGGEVLVASRWRPAPEGLVLEGGSFGTAEVSFDAVRRVEWLAADAGPCHDPAETHGPLAGRDAAHLRSGDLVAGTLEAATQGGFVLALDGERRRTVLWEELLVLHLANEILGPPSDPHVEVETVEGSRLLATRLAQPEDRPAGPLRTRTRSLPEVDLLVPLEGVVACRFLGGRWVHACELGFTGRHEPWSPEPEAVGRRLAEWRRNRAHRRPDGCPLSLGGRVWLHGFAVQARSRLEIPIAKGFRSFEAWFGIDDSARDPDGAPGGLVDASVELDGRVLWEATGVRGGEPPRRVGPLDLRDGEGLVLVVDFGTGMGTLARATWADPVLVRR
jgi:hypothetical protein